MLYLDIIVYITEDTLLIMPPQKCPVCVKLVEQGVLDKAKQEQWGYDGKCITHYNEADQGTQENTNTNNGMGDNDDDSTDTSMSEAGVEWATISAGTLMTTAPLFIAFLIFQRQFIASFMTAGIK